LLTLFNLIVLLSLVYVINLFDRINPIHLISWTLVSIRQVLKPSELSGDALLEGVFNLVTDLTRQHRG
jgi:hypothetical protein